MNTGKTPGRWRDRFRRLAERVDRFMAAPAPSDADFEADVAERLEDLRRKDIEDRRASQQEAARHLGPHMGRLIIIADTMNLPPAEIAERVVRDLGRHGLADFNFFGLSVHPTPERSSNVIMGQMNFAFSLRDQLARHTLVKLEEDPRYTTELQLLDSIAMAALATDDLVEGKIPQSDVAHIAIANSQDLYYGVGLPELPWLSEAFLLTGVKPDLPEQSTAWMQVSQFTQRP